MKYRRLGAAGVNVSEICLGGMTFGEADETSYMHTIGSDQATAFDVMNRAVQLGVNFIDTADVYGQDGLSERTIGAWFARDKRRDEVVLATKFRFSMGSGPNRRGASRHRIVRCVEQSLQRLGTDRIDLYQTHMQDVDVEEEETLRALDDLVRQGKVLYVGCSNYTAYRMMGSLALSERLALMRFVTMQMQYSLVVRDIEREHIPLCRQSGVGILAWSPLASGFLSGKYDLDGNSPTGTRLARHADQLKSYDSERNRLVLSTLREVARELGSTPATVALAWLLTREHVSSVIIGARSLNQLEQNAQACDLELPPACIQQLDKASSFDLGYPYDYIGKIQGRW